MCCHGKGILRAKSEEKIHCKLPQFYDRSAWNRVQIFPCGLGVQDTFWTVRKVQCHANSNYSVHVMGGYKALLYEVGVLITFIDISSSV